MIRLLLIEDNQEIRENMTEILEMTGYQVITASNGMEGITLAGELRPEFILCDMQMPEMKGDEVFQTLKANPATAKIPFVFVTSSAEKRQIQSALNMGVQGYLCKPFDPQELLDLIQKILNKVTPLKTK